MDKGEIYSITCNVNGKRYIGQAVQFINGKRPHGAEGRWKKHTQEAKSKHSRCRALNSAILKYGEHNFTIRVLKICEKSQLNYYEVKYIRQYNTICPNGYNIRHGGSRSKLHESTIQKIREAKSKENNHMYGKHHTDEAKTKISQGNKGKVRTTEMREAMSNIKGRKPSYVDLPMYIYYVKRGKFEGYVIKHHPRLPLTKKSFTSTKFSLEEKLEQAKAYIESL